MFKIGKRGKEIVLHSFRGRDGANPYAGLVRDAQGNLYGTTGSGGVPSGYGTVFKLSKTGKVTVLHKFHGGTTDGCHPNGGLLQDKAGNLYGTTWKCGASGLGTVYKIDSSGTETVLHNFAGGPTDGASPSYGNLLMDKTGNLYGVTSDGGSFPAGTVYMLSPSGILTLLHSFAVGGSDGCYAYGTSAMDKNGTLYGTTEGCGSNFYGMVWKVSQNGTESVLHNFAGAFSDGADPLAGVILDLKGNLYGDAQDGGAAYLGAVYKLSKNGAVTLLHSFDGSDGEYPIGGLIRDATGNIFGTTLRGGSASCFDGCGTVWKLAP